MLSCDTEPWFFFSRMAVMLFRRLETGRSVKFRTCCGPLVSFLSSAQQFSLLSALMMWLDKVSHLISGVAAQEASGRHAVWGGVHRQLFWKWHQQLAEKRHPVPGGPHRPRTSRPLLEIPFLLASLVLTDYWRLAFVTLQTWTPHYFVLTSNKIYYSEETSHYQTADEEEDDEGKEVSRWVSACRFGSLFMFPSAAAGVQQQRAALCRALVPREAGRRPRRSAGGREAPAGVLRGRRQRRHLSGAGERDLCRRLHAIVLVSHFSRTQNNIHLCFLFLSLRLWEETVTSSGYMLYCSIFSSLSSWCCQWAKAASWRIDLCYRTNICNASCFPEASWLVSVHGEASGKQHCVDASVTRPVTITHFVGR